MIRSFRHKGLRRFWEDDSTAGLHGSVERIARILDLLNVAERPEDMNIVGFYFHRLAGKPARYRAGDGQLAHYLRMGRDGCLPGGS